MTFVVAIIYIWSQTAVFIFPIWILIFPILIFVLIIQSNTHVQENKNEVDLDTEELNRIRDALHNNMEMFLLDYILMSVQFFENYERLV